ncbi:transglycosylase SLT domain-containing protein [Maritalea sp.]|uniref:transglycosylase SLT domain-containing protein n=1 Tax=Maritalea sp. TaxID=2003361 RepID=UPI003EF5A7C4
MSGVKPVQVPLHLTQALSKAGDKNGVDFDYLLQTAMRESSLNPEAKAKTSSAVGLFQFIEGTWLEVIKEEGPKLGYGSIADKIERTSDGYEVRDNKLKAGILSLRENPEMSADLAAAFTRRNGQYLQEKFGRMPSPGELYIAHFMGARGAEKFFDLGLSQPNSIAAERFPSQAKANKSIFYEGGRPRTIKQVYQVLVAKHQELGPSQAAQSSAAFAAQQMAVAPTGPFSVGNAKKPVTPFESLYRTPAADALPSRIGPPALKEQDKVVEEDLAARTQSFFSRFYSN